MIVFTLSSNRCGRDNQEEQRFMHYIRIVFGVISAHSLGESVSALEKEKDKERVREC